MCFVFAKGVVVFLQEVVFSKRVFLHVFFLVKWLFFQRVVFFFNRFFCNGLCFFLCKVVFFCEILFFVSGFVLCFLQAVLFVFLK